MKAKDSRKLLTNYKNTSKNEKAKTPQSPATASSAVNKNPLKEAPYRPKGSSEVFSKISDDRYKEIRDLNNINIKEIRPKDKEKSPGEGLAPAMKPQTPQHRKFSNKSTHEVEPRLNNYLNSNQNIKKDSYSHLHGNRRGPNLSREAAARIIQKFYISYRQVISIFKVENRK